MSARGKDRPWRYLRSAVKAPKLSHRQYMRLQIPERRKAKAALLLSKTVHLGHLGQPVLTGKQFRRIIKKARRMRSGNPEIQPANPAAPDLLIEGRLVEGAK